MSSVKISTAIATGKGMARHDAPPAKQAFSLVELSIVLVILGLLVGGVLTGQSLIRAAELRSVTTEYQKYAAAVHTFRDKYFQLPGDMTNATQFWGRQVNAAHCATNSAAAVTSNGVCDGNGNGQIGTPTVASQSSEGTQLWRQLANAGLIEGDYDGLVGSGGLADVNPGVNIPRSKINNAGSYIIYWDTTTVTGDANHYAMNYGNVLTIGAKQANFWTHLAIFKPEEAWNIDTKMDDGKPGRGKVIASWYGPCTLSTSATDYDADYELTNSATACVLRFTQMF